MSIHALSWAWKQDVSPTDKLILLALADHADDDGQCWPGIRGVSEKCNITQRTIFNSLNRLEASGFVRRTPRLRPNGSHASTHYTLALTPLNEIHPPLNVVQYPPERDSPPEPSVRTIIETSKDTPQPPKGESDFHLFWKAYPKKKSKGDAEKAWRALKPTKDLLRAILASVERQKGCIDWTKEGGQYIPHPGRWLRAKGWEDEETVATTLNPDSNLTPTFTDEEAADACIHGWFRSREFRVKHGDPPDLECGRCRADLFPAGDA